MIQYVLLKKQASKRPDFHTRMQSNDDDLRHQPEAHTRVYVGNLPYQALSKDIQELFAQGGFPVAKVDMSTDPFTGRNPSYCFVELASPDDAQRAMEELMGKGLMGRPVKVKPHFAKLNGVKAGFKPRIQSYEQAGPAQIFSASARSDRSTFDRWSRSDPSNDWSGMSEQGPRLYVGGLPRIEPHSTVEVEMQDLFKGFDIQAISKIISPHKSKQSIPGNHYYLFVDLSTASGASAAVDSLNGLPSKWGGVLRVSKARGDSKRVIREQLTRTTSGDSE